MKFSPALKKKIFVAVAILLIGFGTVNLAEMMVKAELRKRID